jgi:hypothetical protein
VARRRARPAQAADQRELDFQARPATPTKRTRTSADVEKAARAAIARRAQPGAPSGKVKLTLTLYLNQEQAERLGTRAIREEKNLEGVVAEILEGGSE